MLRLRAVTQFFVALMFLVFAGVADAAQTTYYHTDELGSVVMESNETGQVTYSREYRPYGERALGSAKDGPGFIGHVADTDTGLTYMQQRYYDPGIGRFLSVDPVTVDSATGANFNRYLYGNNNPYKFVDPDGRAGILASFLEQIKREASNYVLTKTYEFGATFVAEVKRDAVKRMQSHTYSAQVGLGGTIATPIRNKVPMGGSVGVTGAVNASLNNHGQFQLSFSGAPLLGQGGGASGGLSFAVAERDGGADVVGGAITTNHHAELAFSVPQYPLSFGGAVDWNDDGVGLAKGSERFGVGRMLFWGAGEQLNYTYTFNEGWHGDD